MSIKPTFFKTSGAFRKWLEKNHSTKKELLVGYYKVGSGKESMTWPESVDEALCFGWIDGVRRSIDDKSYCIRFTPRRASSNWSAININKMEELLKKGLVTTPGLEAYKKRSDAKSRIYSYERVPDILDKSFEKKFRNNQTAWKFFEQQAPSYKKMVIQWIMGAVQENTRVTRLEKLITASKNRKRL